MENKVKNIMMWALTYRCNMRCEYCFLRERVTSREELSDDECLALAEKLSCDPTWRPNAVWLTGGEPTVRKCLPDIIRILEAGGIRCVVTTNGFCTEEQLSQLLASAPRGINVSLESFDDDINSQNRGNTARVVASISKIAREKSPNTLLGISCVVSPENIRDIPEFADEVCALGVDYLSINPLIGGESRYSPEEFAAFRVFCQKLRAEKKLLLPSEFYFALVEDYFLDKRTLDLPCPTGKHYLFIAPWGAAYPCSNEIWQKAKLPLISVPHARDMKQVFEMLDATYHTGELTTRSGCFGERCIGCWKLYYDTVFTE